MPSRWFLTLPEVCKAGCGHKADKASALQVTVVWDANRLRRSLMLTVLGWASSLHDPATYARLYPAHLPAPTPATASAAFINHPVLKLWSVHC